MKESELCLDFFRDKQQTGALIAFLSPGQQKKFTSVCVYSRHFLNMSTAVKLVSGWIFKNELMLAAGMGNPT